MPACGLFPASTSSCLSARSCAPAKQSNSKRKVRCWASVGLLRSPTPSSSIASSSLPARNSSSALTDGTDASSFAHTLREVVARDGGGARRAVGLLLVIGHGHFSELEIEALAGDVAVTIGTGFVQINEEQLIELELHERDVLGAAGLERRQDGVLEVLPGGDG